MENGIRHWSFGRGCFSVFDYAFITPNITNIIKERKMGFLIAVLVVVILVIVIMRLT